MAQKKINYVIVPDDNIFNQDMQTNSFATFRNMHRALYQDAVLPDKPARLTARSSTGKLSNRPSVRTMNTDAGKIELIDSIDLNEATLTRMTPD